MGYENRPNGVSGLMRVRNDAEFIIPCVESCIDALDELIIVYNDCDDNSPQVIEVLQKRYPTKIKAYHYKYKIIAWNLTQEEIEGIFSNTIPQENTLAGYYNFTLSKATYRYAMKIDADQIYYSERLKIITNAYRSLGKNKIKDLPSLLYVIIYKIICFIAIKIKLKISVPEQIWKRYFGHLIRAIISYKINISLSGINVIYDNHKIFVGLGKERGKEKNTFSPFNGNGDHPVFKVTQNTYFIPYYDYKYNSLIKKDNSVIERLVGIKPLFIGGLLWAHLNNLRNENFQESIRLLNTYPEDYSDFCIFPNDYKSLYNRADNNIFNITNKISGGFIIGSLTRKFMEFVKSIFM